MVQASRVSFGIMDNRGRYLETERDLNGEKTGEIRITFGFEFTSIISPEQALLMAQNLTYLAGRR